MAPHTRAVLLLLCLLTFVQGCSAPSCWEPSSITKFIRSAKADAAAGEPCGWWDEHPHFKQACIVVGIVVAVVAIYGIGIMVNLNPDNT